jgi:periplasmic divalent cation tolerance protein
MKPTKELLCLVYMAVGSIKEVKQIGRILVKQNFDACVNILEKMTSIYKWKDDLEEDGEVVMTAKTCKTHMPQLIKTVTEHHSYECPCILELPIEGVNTEYLRWIETETDIT